MVLVSSKYTVSPSSMPQKLLIEHCALMDPWNHWLLEVKYKSGLATWKSLDRDVDTDIGAVGILVTFPPLKEKLEIAAFGNPGEKDIKRKHIGIFGTDPVKGSKWIVYIYVFDETTVAFQVFSMLKQCVISLAPTFFLVR